jgi:hypothetical protein
MYIVVVVVRVELFPESTCSRCRKVLVLVKNTSSFCDKQNKYMYSYICSSFDNGGFYLMLDKLSYIMA